MSLQRTGRVIVYTNQVPYSADVLRTNMYKMADISKLAETVLGTGLSNTTLVAGGNCTPTGPASLTVDIAPITIYQSEEYDATDYGVIPDDSTLLYKQGINLEETNVTGFVAPGSMGQTNYYLLQAELLTSDVNVVSRPYYNSASPSTPIFTSQADTRVDTVSLTIKVSLVSTPAPDAGNVGLWAINVAYGQTTITSGDISQYASAPFITESLTQKVSYTNLQKSNPLYGVDTGSANTYAVTATPVYSAVVAGTTIRVKIANTNTGASTLNISGIGAQPIRKQSPIGLLALTGGELKVGQIYEFMFDGTYFQLISNQNAFFYGASVYRTTDQAILSMANAVFSADAVKFDPYSIWNDSTKVFTPLVKGYYLISARIYSTASAATGSVFIQVLGPGPLEYRLSQMEDVNTDLTLSGSVMLQLNGSTDGISLKIYNGTDKTVNFGQDLEGSDFSIQLIGQ